MRQALTAFLLARLPCTAGTAGLSQAFVSLSSSNVTEHVLAWHITCSLQPTYAQGGTACAQRLAARMAAEMQAAHRRGIHLCPPEQQLPLPLALLALLPQLIGCCRIRGALCLYM